MGVRLQALLVTSEINFLLIKLIPTRVLAMINVEYLTRDVVWSGLAAFSHVRRFSPK